MVPVLVELTEEAYEDPPALPGFRCTHRLAFAHALVGELERSAVDDVERVPGVVRVELDTDAIG